MVQKKNLIINGKSVCISGRSYSTQFEGENPLKNVKIPVDSDYNILMIHGSLQGLNVASSVPEYSYQNPFRAEDISNGLNYLALGHFHNHFERKHKDCMIVNPGSIEKLSWAEINDEKGFVWADLNGKETSTEFIKLKSRPMEIKQLSLSKNGKYPKGIINYILALLNQSKNPEKILKLVLNGLLSQNQYAELKTNEILRSCNDSFFNLQIDRRDLEIEGYGRVFMEKLDNPVEAYSKRLDLIIGKLKQDNPDKKFLESVKRLGIKYLEATK